MATLPPIFTTLTSLLFLLLLHLGCFIFPSNRHHHHQSKKLKPKTPSRLKLKTHKAFSSSWSLLKRIFTSKPGLPTQTHPNSTAPSPSLSSSARCSQHSSIISVPPTGSAQIEDSDPPPRKRRTSSGQIEISADHHFFPLRNDIYPCPICGEIFLKPNLLEQHQAIKHAVSELFDGDSGKNIVRIIFETGWPGHAKNPIIHRVLKIHNSTKILTLFEEYREAVKSKAARNGVVRVRNERCIADGNELLRFHCTTFLCDLGQNGNSSICNHQYCSVCGIIKSGFSPKMDGISTLSTSWRGHVAIPEEIEEELLVFNPRAVLPCFVIMYTV